MSRQVCDLFAASAFARRLALEIEGNFGCGLASLARAGSTSSQIRLSDGVISACLMLGKSGSLAARLVIPEAQYGITSRAGQISVYGRKNGGMPRDAFCHDASINDRAAQALDALDMSENSGLRAVLALYENRTAVPRASRTPLLHSCGAFWHTGATRHSAPERRRRHGAWRGLPGRRGRAV